ncbi:hypothetical protein [Prevotella sp. 10(H)]|uniref:hypothetical protein n=1 Tax=Prevotella sp. 10(H) TaxID=1158294 RepID=UPI0004A7271D|nr:hypothetical protein [Prevotella sp. 10(H)]
MKTAFIFLLLVLINVNSIFSQISIPADTAKAYYDEAKAISDKDNGRLWGISIYAPTLFIDPDTRDLVSNVTDNEGLLKKYGDIYFGKFPEDKIIANSTTRFGGKDYTMVMYPLPIDKYMRNVLIIHEMFHYRQPELGLSIPKDVNSYRNKHADDMQARIYFKLEWKALEKAVRENKANLMKKYIREALIFRAYRQSLFEKAARDESMFELHEGLPEYTAHTLCSESEEALKEQVLIAIERIYDHPSYIRSFAYSSGFAYAYLLDKVKVEWRKGLKYDNDLSKLLQTACKIELPSDIEKAKDGIKNKYDFETINKTESKRKEDKDKLQTLYREMFTQKPVLIIPLTQPNIGFNPNGVESLGELGSVYADLYTAIDLWGKLNISEGACLLGNGWRQLTVPAENVSIEGNIVKTSDWTLELNNDYIVEKVGNNYTLRKR